MAWFVERGVLRRSMRDGLKSAGDLARALSRLARDRVITFAEKGRREVRIPDLQALAGFVQRYAAASLH